MKPSPKKSESKNSHSFPIELFFDQQFAESYQCTICDLIPSPEEASNHAKCGAVFCKSCLDTWLTKHKDCPKCRANIFASLTKNENHIVYQLHQKLTLRCPESEKCAWKGTFAQLSKHSEECVYHMKECKYSIAGCSFKGTGDALIEHEKNYKDQHLEMCLATIKILTKEELPPSISPKNSSIMPNLNRKSHMKPNLIVEDSNSLAVFVRENEEIKDQPKPFIARPNYLIDAYANKHMMLAKPPELITVAHQKPEVALQVVKGVAKEKHELRQQKQKLQKVKEHLQEELRDGNNKANYLFGNDIENEANVPFFVENDAKIDSRSNSSNSVGSSK